MAQREFSGLEMFVEQGRGGKHAWVRSHPQNKQLTMLDFFAGTAQSDQALGNAGSAVILEKDKRRFEDMSFRVDDAERNLGAKYFGNESVSLDFFADPIQGGGNSACPLELNPVQRVFSDGPDQLGISTAWQKVAMYRGIPTQICPSGPWLSQISSVLDLDDGTMLVTMPDYVFRLRIADLEPEGRAPTLHVVDADAIKRIIQSAPGGSALELNEYLAEQLGLQGK